MRKLIERELERVIAWNRWRKHCLNSRMHKICVLLRLENSPTFAIQLSIAQAYRRLKDEENRQKLKKGEQ